MVGPASDFIVNDNGWNNYLKSDLPISKDYNKSKIWQFSFSVSCPVSPEVAREFRERSLKRLQHRLFVKRFAFWFYFVLTIIGSVVSMCDYYFN